MNYVKKTIPLITVIAFSSCATMFTSGRQTVRFTTTTPGAKVIINENLVGITPCQVKVRKRPDAPAVVVKQEGFETKRFEMEQKVSPVTYLNILNLGFGAMLDFATGKCFKYEDSYTIDLDKEKVK